MSPSSGYAKRAGPMIIELGTIFTDDILFIYSEQASAREAKLIRKAQSW